MSLSVHNNAAPAPPDGDGDETAAHAPNVTARGVHFRLATPGDDAAIRTLLRAQPMHGRIQLSVQTEPSFLRAAAHLGEPVEVIVAQAEGDSSLRIVGLGVRATRRVFLAGQRRRIAHLSFLRVHSDFRRRREFLRAGYDLLHLLHQRDPVDAGFTAILKDNLPARRTLEAGHRGLPQYTPVADLVTLALPTTHTHTPRAGCAVRAFQPDDRAAAHAFLHRTMAAQPLGLAGDPDALDHPAPGALSWNDFVIARSSANGSIAALAALWDQRPFRQLVIAGYAPSLTRLRPLYNATRFLYRGRRLPAPGAALRLAYISHLALDHPMMILPVLAALGTRARAAGIDTLALSLPASHPCCLLLARRATHRTESILYRVHWPGDAAFPPLATFPYVEAALL